MKKLSKYLTEELLEPGIESVTLYNITVNDRTYLQSLCEGTDLVVNEITNDDEDISSVRLEGREFLNANDTLKEAIKRLSTDISYSNIKINKIENKEEVKNWIEANTKNKNPDIGDYIVITDLISGTLFIQLIDLLKYEREP